MTLKLYNTLTHREEPFEPIDSAGKNITFYSCGPTVYDYAHIGNFRSFLNADVLRRTLELLGYTVRHVMNMTDVGHMTDDEQADGGGEDKMQVAARRLLEAKKAGTLPPGTNIDPNDPFAIAEFYALAFLQDADTLGLKLVQDARRALGATNLKQVLDADARASLLPRPTKFVPEMIEHIQSLIARGHAYVASDGVVYFSVQSFPEYGKLSGNTPESIRSGEGGRVSEANQAVKRHPADFMLWKPDSRHLMKWPSPWGEGYPGWHLECSVMARALLGDEIDLHSGGEDNIFPHHECEIAQTCGLTGQPFFARHWFHTRFLIVEGEKMSKSKGNFFTVRDLIAKGASPAAIRLELIKTHYRSQANFTMQGLKDSQRMIERWARLKDWLEKDVHQSTPATTNGPLSSALAVFKQSLSNDLNVSGAIAALNEAAGSFDMSAAPRRDGLRNELEALHQMNSVLGVFDVELNASTDAGDIDAGAIEAKIAERNAARKNKDFATSDRIRDELLAMGIAIKDGPQGTTWSRVIQ